MNHPNRVNHPSRTRLHGELGDVRQRRAEIDENLGYQERTFVETDIRRRHDRVADRRHKWTSRAAVVGAVVALAAGVELANRAIAQNDESHRAENGNIPQLVHQKIEQHVAQERAENHLGK